MHFPISLPVLLKIEIRGAHEEPSPTSRLRGILVLLVSIRIYGLKQEGGG